MKRLFWLSLGVAAGVVIARKLNAAANRISPSSNAARAVGQVGDIASNVREFIDDLKDVMHEHEDELRETLGLAGDTDDTSDNDSKGTR